MRGNYVKNENFGISMNDVKSLYKQLMRELHPDRHTMKPAEEQQRLHNEAAKVTHAYNVILHPHTRATHLLELRGRPLDGTSQVWHVCMRWRLFLALVPPPIDPLALFSLSLSLSSRAYTHMLVCPSPLG